MEQPQFNNSQFVSETIFNTAFGQVLSSITDMGNGPTFFIPGVAGSAAFTFTNSLVVNINASNLKCLFTTGNYAEAHGTLTGTDSSLYSVNFNALVPVSGSVTAYIVATYTTIQLDPVVIVGPPPGHPDYSANFVPYVGYTRIQDSLNIFTTTTVPNNLTVIELARVPISAGQTIITSVDTSHQIPASINPVPVSMAGDITGKSDNNTISALQGRTVNLTGLSTGSYLKFNGTQWVPGTVAGSFPPNGPASGDLTGNYPSPQVLQSTTAQFTANKVVSNNDIIANHNITANGNMFTTDVTANNTITAAGEIFGANAATGGAAVMLRQLLGSGLHLSGPNTTAHFTIPIWTGSVVEHVIIQIGSFQPTTFISANTTYSINFPIVFPGILGMLVCNPMGGDPTSPPGSVVNFPSNTGFQYTMGPVAAIALYWLAVGD